MYDSFILENNAQWKLHKNTLFYYLLLCSFIQAFILLPHSMCRSSESIYLVTIWTIVQYPDTFNTIAKVHILNKNVNKTIRLKTSHT